MQENAKSLIIYLVEKYNDKFENIHYVDIFKKLKTKYDQVKSVFQHSCAIKCDYTFPDRRFVGLFYITTRLQREWLQGHKILEL